MLKQTGMIAVAALAAQSAAAQDTIVAPAAVLDAIVVIPNDEAANFSGEVSVTINSVLDRESIVAVGSTVGTKTGTPILDVPASVSVVTQKEMEQRGVSTLDEALAYTAGVSTDIYGSDNRYDFYLIRGFYQTALGTYRDGLSSRIPGFVGSRLEPFGLERIEILKGSTSTLFGLNAPGGLVNAVTKKPLDFHHGEIYSTFGEEHVEGGVDVGGPVDKDGKFLYRFVSKGQNGRDGTEYSNDDRIYIAPAVTWRPTSATEFTVLTDYNRRDGNTSHGIPFGSGIDPDTYLGEPDFDTMDTEEWNVGYQFSHDFGNGLQFRQNARYTNLDLTYESVYGATSDPSVNRSAWAVYGDTQRFGIDNQLQFDTAVKGIESRTLVGADYYYEKVTEQRIFGAASGIDINDPQYCGLDCIFLPPGYEWNYDRSAFGVYVQEELTFLDRFIVTLGGRYDNVDTNSDYPDFGLAYSGSDEAFTGRAGLTVKLREDVSVYANYSESFEPVSAELTLLNEPKPQEGTQYEVGLKYRPSFFDEALFSVAVFDIKQTNVPYNVSVTTQDQIGEVRVRGLEIEGKVSLTDKLNATMSYSYWDPEIVTDGVVGNVGNRPLLVPNHIGSAWLDYTIPGQGRFGDLTLGAGVRYVGDTYADNANTIKLDARTVVDAALTYQVFENASLQLNATNLFDEEYISSVDTFSNTAYYGDGRTLKATFRYTW